MCAWMRIIESIQKFSMVFIAIGVLDRPNSSQNLIQISRALKFY